MTVGYALLVQLMSRYLGGLLDPSVTLLEVHKPGLLLSRQGFGQLHGIMQQSDDLDVAIRRDPVDDEMTGWASPLPDVERANAGADLIARATGRRLRMLK